MSISHRCFLSSRSEVSRYIPSTIMVAPAKINSQTYRVSIITASYTNFVVAHCVIVDYPYNGNGQPELFFCSDYRFRCLSQRGPFGVAHFSPVRACSAVIATQLSEVYGQVFDSHLSRELSLLTYENALRRRSL